MKLWLIGALIVAMAAPSVPTSADAKRLGGGRPAGMQRNMPARTAPDAPPAKPAQPAQATPGTPAAAPAVPPAAAPKRNWMGPLAGLAAGLGIAALLSHFGMGGAAANLLMMALLAAAAVFLVMFLLRRFGPGAARGPALAGAGMPGNWSQPAPLQRRIEPEALAPVAPPVQAPAAAAAPLENTVTRAFVPAAFDADGFARTAKLIFIRLQTANDMADLDDLRRFTTPELFASIRLDLQDRGSKPQKTDVLKVDAEVLDVVNEADRQIVSVRFNGQVVEEQGTPPAAFNEVWHLVKPLDGSREWAIAGIEQLA